MAKPGAQPDLPGDFPWPAATLAWWKALGETDQARTFTAFDWESMKSAAMLHADVWGNYNVDRIPDLNRILARYDLA